MKKKNLLYVAIVVALFTAQGDDYNYHTYSASIESHCSRKYFRLCKRDTNNGKHLYHN
jgi:hypothetical protein